MTSWLPIRLCTRPPFRFACFANCVMWSMILSVSGPRSGKSPSCTKWVLPAAHLPFLSTSPASFSVAMYIAHRHDTLHAFPLVIVYLSRFRECEDGNDQQQHQQHSGVHALLRVS